MTSLEVYAQGDRNTLRDLVVLDNAKGLVPDSFKTAGTVDWGAVALAVRTAQRLRLDPVDNLKLLPVIKNQVFPMAEIWRVMARRHGWRVTLVVDTADRVVVDMVHYATGEHPPPFELTLDEARLQGAAKTNPNYQDGGARAMLRAQATRTAIRLNAPEVLQDPVFDDLTPGLACPPPDVTPGPTLTEPATVAADPGPDNRQVVRNALDRLTPGQTEDVKAEWRNSALPNLTDPQFCADNALTAMSIIVDVLADDQPPAEVYDVGYDPDRDDDHDTYRYAPDDDGRPFAS